MRPLLEFSSVSQHGKTLLRQETHAQQASLIEADYLLADRTRGEEDLDEAPEDEDHQAGKQHGAQVAAKESTDEEMI